MEGGSADEVNLSAIESLEYRRRYTSPSRQAAIVPIRMGRGDGTPWIACLATRKTHESTEFDRHSRASEVTRGSFPFRVRQNYRRHRPIQPAVG